MVLPALHQHFHGPIERVQWIMTAMLLASTASFLPAGRLGDRYGRDRVWQWGMLLFSAASLVCMVSDGLWMLIGARALQGIGASAAAANAAPLLVEAYPDHRGWALACASVAIGLGLVLGAPIGALLTQAASWRWLFLVAVPFGFGAWLLSRGSLPCSERRQLGADLPGTLTSALGLAALLVGGSFGTRWHWTSAPTLATLGAGIVLLAGFFVIERHSEQPLLSLDLLRHRTFLLRSISAMFGYGSLFTIVVALPYFLIEGQRRALWAAGLLVGVISISLGVVAPIAGAATDRIGSRLICAGGLLMVAAGLILATLASSAGSAKQIAVAMALCGAGLGAFEGPNSAAALGALSEEELGIGTATMGLLRNLGMTFGAAMAATLIGYAVAGSGRAYALRIVAGVHLAELAGAGVAIVGAVLAVLSPD